MGFPRLGDSSTSAASEETVVWRVGARGLWLEPLEQRHHLLPSSMPSHSTGPGSAEQVL